MEMSKEFTTKEIDMDDIEYALGVIGVNLKDSEGNYRALEVLLEEVAVKFREMSNFADKYYMNSKENYKICKERNEVIRSLIGNHLKAYKNFRK